MKRMTRPVQEDRCDACDQAVLTSNWDDYEQMTSPIVVDPTPLDGTAQVACVIADRPIYVLEQTAVKTFRLSQQHAYNGGRQTYAPALILPKHRCAGRFPTSLPPETAVAICGLIPEPNRLATVPF